MKVLIPHKDILFSLSKLQENFIFTANNYPEKSCTLIPNFPLWAFSDSENFEKELNFSQCRKCVFTKIEFDGEKKFYFSLDFFYTDSKKDKKEVKIYFAQKISEKKLNIDFINTKLSYQIFPLKMNVFKIAGASEKNFSWKIFDEKWIKIKK